MKNGYFSFILHAHLPYVRHREANRLEERWVFEAMTETYIPLLWVLQEQEQPACFGISFSPPVLEMLSDPVVQRRYVHYLENTEELIRKEKSLNPSGMIADIVRFYEKRYKKIRETFYQWGQNLINGFKHYEAEGKIECFTTAATHAFLPYIQTKEALRAQIVHGILTFEKHFGKRPAGFWLPECAYTPGVDKILFEEGIRYTFVDEHTLKNGSPKPDREVGAPVYSSHGIVLFPRCEAISQEVWSSITGYPGDFDYREFYRDIVYDRDWEYIKPHVHPEGFRTDSGLKYHRITGPTEEKAYYVREWAENKAKIHAEDFIQTIEERLEKKKEECYPPHLITSPFDAELFGHWWFEGPDFLSSVLEKGRGRIEFITPSEYINRHYRDLETIHAAFSTWGRDGYGDVWLNEKNAWMYRHLHKCEREIISTVARYSTQEPLRKRYIQQMIREWMLASSSDWAFIVDNDSATAYAINRFTEHIERFHKIYEQLKSNRISSSFIVEYEKDYPFLETIDTTIFQTSHDHYIKQHYKNLNSDTEKMNIAMLSWEFPPMVVGGLGRHVFDLAKQLVKLGANVYVITSDVEGYPTHEINEGIHVYRVKGLQPQNENFFHWVGSLNLAMMDQVRNLAKLIPFDCIHAHDWLVSVAAKGLKQELSIPLIATIHATEHGRNNGIHDPLQFEINQKEWELMFEADEIIVCSNHMKNELCEVFQVPENKVTILPNGVDPELFKPEAIHDYKYKQHGETLVFSVGRMVKEKGFQTIIEAAHLLKNEQDTIKFVIAGKGPLLEHYRRAVHEQQLSDIVHFIGYVSDEERNRLLAECDIALFPSHYEPFGIVALEGMIAGKATVVSETGGLKDIVKHEETGLTIYPNDPASLASAVLRLAREPGLRKKLALSGKHVAKNVFNWERIAKKTLKLMEQNTQKNNHVGSGV
ncbi:1,4-alpha-glucan branching protein domain-containing protein [Fictibacillus gelatini]|uniref:1,4-alpha-glucan branching protein domain-containing protein n=1 Tax=Fictibacillus gelatini TaxID=225985 RepID=UPI000406B5CF|nr:1,4-alpha-glucan branching protein domain-containing protein [Fictibacillus gelatini]